MYDYGESFAPAYDRMWTWFADDVTPRLVDFYRNSSLGGKMAPVLDVCCGTGAMALRFLAEGYGVTGIDLSEPMLEISRDHAREWIEEGKARFIQACATSFEPPGNFGLVTSIFDSLNHLENEDQLAACFARVRDSLLPGGHFIFDLNTRRSLARWGEITVDDDPEAMVVKRGGYDEVLGKAFFKVSGFLLADDGRYDRFEQMIVETVFEMSKVRELLLRAGFISAYPAHYRELHRQVDDPEDMDRVFFVAMK